MQPTTENYLLWLKERGLYDLPFSTATVTMPSQAIAMRTFDTYLGTKPKILVLAKITTDLLTTLPNAEKLLLGKLIKTFGFTFNDVVLIAVRSTPEKEVLNKIRNLREDYNIKLQVCLGQELTSVMNGQQFGLPMQHDNIVSMVTYAPCELLAEEALKRTAWEHIKQFNATIAKYSELA